METLVKGVWKYTLAHPINFKTFVRTQQLTKNLNRTL